MGKGRPGRSATLRETWIAQLQQINHISLVMATAIASEYETYRALMTMYQMEGLTESDKRGLLANIRVDNPYGKSKDRVIGMAASTRIYEFFTATDGQKVVK